MISSASPIALKKNARPASVDTRLSLRANFLWTFFGRLVYVGCQWGMLAVLTKMGSPEMVGLFSLGLAITTPIVVLSMLQLRAVQATDAVRQYEFGHYLALRIATSFLALLVIAALACTASYQREVALTIIAIGIFKIIESISDVYYGFMQQRDRMDRIALALMMKGPLSLLGLATGVYLTGKVIWGIIALTAFSVLVLRLYDRNSALRLLGGSSRAIQARWDWQQLYQLARLAFPLGIVMMLISLNTNIPRYFVEKFLGLRDLGYFAALVYPQAAGVMIVGALGQAASPRLARYFSAGQRRAFFQLLGKIVAVGVVLGITAVLAAMFFGREILTLLYKAEYAKYQPVFVWLMLAAGLSFVASFFGYGLTAARYFRAQVPLFASSALLTALGCGILIPRMGLIGAAAALAIAALFNIVGSVLLISSAFRANARQCYE